MCGRYYADDDTIREIARLVGEIDKTGTEAGDILPSRQAAVITGLGHPLVAARMAWGFPKFDGKGLVINARAESALEKRSFRESVLHRRCVIPARGFYEWNKEKEKEKFTFERPDRDVLFMAGCFCPFDGQDRFVILTTAANPSVSPVHSRMPLILERDELTAWVRDDTAAARLLEKAPVMLTRKTEYEQLRLF